MVFFMFSPTTLKGQIGEAAVAYAAALKGYFVSRAPEGAPYDMIIDRGSLSRVQVKYITKSKGTLTLRLDTLGANGKLMRRYDSSNIDAIVIYEPIDKKTYWVPVRSLSSTSSKNAVMTIRVDPSKNNQTKGVTWASEFEEW